MESDIFLILLRGTNIHRRCKGVHLCASLRSFVHICISLRPSALPFCTICDPLCVPLYISLCRYTTLHPYALLCILMRYSGSLCRYTSLHPYSFLCSPCVPLRSPSSFLCIPLHPHASSAPFCSPLRHSMPHLHPFASVCTHLCHYLDIKEKCTRLHLLYISRYKRKMIGKKK